MREFCGGYSSQTAKTDAGLGKEACVLVIERPLLLPRVVNESCTSRSTGVTRQQVLGATYCIHGRTLDLVLRLVSN